MSCELIERVSLLVDGELSPGEAGAVERHLGVCAECRQAHADFLSLRHELSAYTATLDPLASRRALAEVLAAGRAAAPAGQVGAGGVRGWRARLADALTPPRFSPAFAGALALLLVACAVAFVVYKNAARGPQSVAQTPTPEAPPAVKAVTPQNDQLARANAESHAESNANLATPPVVERATAAAGNVERGAQRERAASAVANATRGNTARSLNARRVVAPELLPPPERGSVPQFVNASAPASEAGARVRPADAETLTVSHVEQSELLLRAFRNARLDERGAADLAYERRRARQLLYQNMVLRREAEAAGNVQLSDLLDSLEPILLDIANLPAAAPAADVRAIQARMQRKNLVALLQVNSATLARAYDD
ncbi:MAG TPA: zf-HC2 domain-containing protein [Pyrinomonadaceae bacterium]|jgi:anti-sigma factor RsiW